MINKITIAPASPLENEFRFKLYLRLVLPYNTFTRFYYALFLFKLFNELKIGDRHQKAMRQERQSGTPLHVILTRHCVSLHLPQLGFRIFKKISKKFYISYSLFWPRHY